MKSLLLLSSGGFIEKEIAEVFEKPLSKYKIAHIVNASKVEEGGLNSNCLKRARTRLTNKNINFEDLDLVKKEKTNLENFSKILMGFL